LSSHATFTGFDFEVDFGAFCFNMVLVFFDFTELEASITCCASVLGSKRSLRSVAVAGVQVDMEPTAARIESAVA
jgi:hypothetical protein